MERPPIDIDGRLSEYLFRQLSLLDAAIRDFVLPKLTALPAKPVVGKIYYFSSAVLPSITAEGYWGYKSTGWVLLG